jgi:HEAT repeat protein
MTLSSRHPFAVSEAERLRLERIDRLVAGGAPAVDELTAELADPSWTVRRAVVGALAALGDEAVPALLATLGRDRRDETVLAAVVEALVASSGDVESAAQALAEHPDPAVVADVAQVLGRRRRRVAIPLLIALASHPNDNVAVAAIEALGRLGGRAAVEALLAAVASGNFFRTFPAIDVLGRSGDPRAVQPLASLLENRHYALEAARALGRTGDKNAVAPLAGRLTAPTIADVRVAASALARLREEYEMRFGQTRPVEEILRRAGDARAATRRLGQALADADAEEKAAICTVLGILGEEAAVPHLIPLLAQPGAVGSAAHQALRRLGQKSDQLLAEALRESDSGARTVLLPLVSSSVALSEVLACLEDEEAVVRAAACAALARIGNPSVVESLFCRLEDGSPLVVQAAIAAIQSLGTSQTQVLALKAARAPSPRMRRWGLRILAYFGYTSGLDAILDATRDPDPHVRDSALYALSFMEGPRAKEALLTATRDPEPATRAAAVRALGNCPSDPRLEGATLGSLEDPDAWVRYYACQTAGRLRIEAAVPRLSRLLGDPAGQVRLAAIEGLSHFDEVGAREALTAAARSSDDDVRRAAIIGLGIARPPEALAVVAEALQAPDAASRLVAVSALAGFDAPEVNELLARAVEDRDESVRNGAVGALAGRQGPDATSVLIDLLGRSVNFPLVQQALAYPSPERIAGILAGLEGADDDLAPELTSALARMGDAAGAAALMKALTLQNPAARKAAAATLGGLGSREARAALAVAATEDPHPEVRRICAVVLA